MITHTHRRLPCTPIRGLAHFPGRPWRRGRQVDLQKPCNQVRLAGAAFAQTGVKQRVSQFRQKFRMNSIFITSLACDRKDICQIYTERSNLDRKAPPFPLTCNPNYEPTGFPALVFPLVTVYCWYSLHHWILWWHSTLV